MPVISRAALKKQIAAGDTAPLYLLLGDDDGEKSAVAAEFAEMVDEGLRAFSVDRLFGAEVKAEDLIDAAATLPMSPTLATSRCATSAAPVSRPPVTTLKTPGGKSPSHSSAIRSADSGV